MKTVSAAIAYFAALMAVCWFGAGCATIGDGKLEPVTKGAAKAALTAGAVAAPEYAAVLKRIQAQIEGYGEKQTAAVQSVPSGPLCTNWFYKGAAAEPKDISWRYYKEEFHTASDSPPPSSNPPAAVSLEDADDALAAAIAELLADEE